MTYRSADKSLARPGRKQARKHIRDARDFNNFETRAVIRSLSLSLSLSLSISLSLSVRQGAEGNSRHSDRNIGLFPSKSASGFISNPVCFFEAREISTIFPVTQYVATRHVI